LDIIEKLNIDIVFDTSIICDDWESDVDFKIIHQNELVLKDENKINTKFKIKADELNSDILKHKLESLKLKCEKYDFISEILESETRNLTKDEKLFHSGFSFEYDEYMYFKERRMKEFIIDRKGRIHRVAENLYFSRWGWDGTSFHDKITKPFFQNVKYPKSHAVNKGWIIIGSHVGFKIIVMPTIRQIETLKKLGWHSIWFNGEYLNINN